MLNLPLSVSSSSRDVTTRRATRRPVLETGRWLLLTTVAIVAACTSTAPPPLATKLVVSVLPCSTAVTAKDASGNTASGYTGTVHFTSTDPAAVLPPDYTFVGADAGTHTFPVTLKTAGSQTVTATDFTNSLTGSQAITVPALSDKPLYVANAGPVNGSSVMVYAAGASCNETPMATISGNNTGLNGSDGIALDGVGRLYVANTSGGNTITVFAAGAAGNTTPTATIAGSNTGLNGPGGIALDAAGRLYVANGGDITNSGGNTITVYAAGATGNATPIATIAGSNTGLNGPTGIALDGAGRVYVANIVSNTITVYAAGATGNATPTATIAGSNTGLRDPVGIALDAAGQLYVANRHYPSSITVYAAGATGNATPTATIAGNNTGLSGSVGIALDAAGQLYVTNTQSPQSPYSITVYAAGAMGDAAPITTIAGSNTGLTAPSAITF